MDQLEIMRQRHSVRQYISKTIPQEIRDQLNTLAEEYNTAGNLNIQIFYDEPECFSSRMAKYGRFENCTNYIAMVGRKAPDLDERVGYYGELLVLKAQQLGLNTCWVAMTHGKTKAKAEKGEKEVIVISLGYGATQGKPHKDKPLSSLCNISDDSPEWFRKGMEAVLLAPTAVNQQKYLFTLEGNNVKARTVGIGSCLKIDLGIVKCHFELGAGKENFNWI